MQSKLKGLIVGVAAGVLVLTALPVAAQPQGPDQEVVGQLHQLGEDAIATAGLAETRAVNPRVAVLAAKLRADRSAQNEKLMTYAARKNMSVSAIESPGNALAHGVLARASVANSPPEEFDYRFISKVVADHQAAIDAATAAQRLAWDPELKGTIGAQLVVLTENLVAAQELAARIPAPQPRILSLPAFPAGVSRTQTGADEPSPEARRVVESVRALPNP